MPPITAAIITYNEEHDLPRALGSLAGIVDEIVLIDSGSTDRTCEIARSFGARVFTRALDGFAAQRNFAAAQCSNDWILMVDADYELSPELRASLSAWKTGEPRDAAYEMASLTNFLGGWIRHSGWYPDYKILLYRRDLGEFAGAIHERVLARGTVGRLQGDVFHYTVRTFAENRAKLDAMTTLAAEDLFARGRKSWRAAMIFAPPWTMVQRLVFQLGVLDGWRGALIAWLAAKYIYFKYRKLGRLLAGETLVRRSWPNPGEA